MDVTQALRDTENALRDFIASALSKSLGDDWVEKCGVPPDRIQKWKDRKLVEESRQESGVVDERLIYYADFFDLKTILKKNWSGEFSEALGDWKTMEVWLNELEKLRDPDAHRRELLPHQKHLALGIAGEIRTRLPIEFRLEVRNRSKTEWQHTGNFNVAITDEDIGRYFTVSISIRSPRPYHAHGSYDQNVEFKYTVLPKK
ncbi:MAG: Swt1 family HEPN domain-containing protein [Nitrospirae bacterium]|nr:Swt1 family HEPN domain-containing protein [Nitrospirota bacterium]